ncbi:MAG: DUF2203 family protein [Pseudobdellovibrionaceae bacterium]
METIFEINRRRTFNAEQVDEVLPLIYRITEVSSREVQSLINRMDALNGQNEKAILEIEGEINEVISKWQAKVEKLGGLPKGLWIADFDSGEGYYCWKFPELQIQYWHGYQDGFTGRRKIETCE